jgi:hypothetical protein
VNKIRTGESLRGKKALNKNQVQDVLKDCRESGIRRFFGRITIDKGYLTEAIVNKAMMDIMKEEIMGG